MTKTKKAFDNPIGYQMLFCFKTVGITRFELATPRPPDECATGLRYIPLFVTRYWLIRADE